MKKIVAITLSKKEDPELIAKINAVVPYQYKAAHTMVKDILHEWLDKRIAELGINIYQTEAQPAVG
jgi:hypothetical protein